MNRTASTNQRIGHSTVFFTVMLMIATFIATSSLPANHSVLPVAFAEEHEMKCYSDGFDRDGDGYAGLTAEDARTAHRWFKWDGKLRTNCPSGYVRFVADCNDLDPNINPGKGERGSNGKDDNCNGVVDEPTFSYFAEGNHNTTSGFRIIVNLNSRERLDSRAEGKLYADMEYASLKNSGNVVSRTKFLINLVHPPTTSARIDVSVPDSATVYRARLRFFRRTDDGKFVPVGDWSGWYYTMTDGEIEKTQTRARIVLKGLKQYSDSLNGFVGYRGTEDVDGTRFGADRNEGYCTEFYVWVVKHWLPAVGGNDTWDDMIDFFRDHDSYFGAAEVPTRGAPGDYLPIDSNDDGKKNHSGMLLGYDTSRNRAWTLEGNSGNKVVVKTRQLDTEIKGLGHLMRSELRLNH